MDEGRIDNLTELMHLNEASVFNTIKERYMADDIYTYSGIVLVSVNPYRRLPLYSDELIRTFHGRSRDELEPHLFAVAEEAYKSLVRDIKSQSIIISGESGAGKTISAKYIMRYLAEICKAGTDLGTIESKILAANPILEAFGNAKTCRNDNSSRFGKYVQILFNHQNQIVGANIKSFLLEKTRVVGQAEGERNYHIFYQIISGLDSALLKEYSLDNDEFEYLRNGKIDGVDDSEEFRLTLESLKLAGFSPDTLESLWKTLSGILHIGNILIIEDQDGYASIPSGDKALHNAARLLGIDEGEFGKWITHRLIKAGNEQVESKLSKPLAVSVRDSISRHIYDLVFSFIIETLNKTLRPEKILEQLIFIGVLDIYGFEKFDSNSFEQFCINYANEKLQYQFNQQVFKLEQALYESEGIQWSFINFNDNQPCIDMIEGNQGILKMIAEECRIPNGSNGQLAEKINMKFDDSLLVRTKFDKAETFTIKHFAYDVPYCVDGFLEKNKDSFPAEQLAVLQNSSNAFINDLFNRTQEESFSMSQSSESMTRDTNKNIGLGFKASLNDLVKVMSDTETHYIRCIKPNEMKRPHLFDASFVSQQLKACGIIETIRISAAGFPGRWTFKDFAFRYRVLSPASKMLPLNVFCNEILSRAELENHQYQCGKSRVFLRAGVLSKLEELRSSALNKASTSIQAAFRRYKSIKARLSQIEDIKLIQQTIRLVLARTELVDYRQTLASTKMCSIVRMFLAKNALKENQSLSNLICRTWRCRKSTEALYQQKQKMLLERFMRTLKSLIIRQAFLQQVKAANAINNSFRKSNARNCLRALRLESRSVAKMKENTGTLEAKIIELATKLKQVELEAASKAEKLSSSTKYNEDLQQTNCSLKQQLQKLEGTFAKLLEEKEGFLEQLQLISKERLKNEEYLNMQINECKEQLQNEVALRMELESRLSKYEMRRKNSLSFKLSEPNHIEISQIINDPLIDEELKLLARTCGGYDPRNEKKIKLKRIPTLIVENLVSIWLEVEPEPIKMSDQFCNFLKTVKESCFQNNQTTLTLDQKFSFWIANLLELLSFFQFKITKLTSDTGIIVVNHEQKLSTAMIVLLQMRTDAARTVEELYRFWLAELCKWFGRIGPVAILDHQGLSGYSESQMNYMQKSSRIINEYLLGRRGSTANMTIEVLIDGLEELCQAMISAELQTEIAQQLLNSTLNHIFNSAFNELLIRKSFATWRRGIQVQFNLSQLEDWASRLRLLKSWIQGPPIPSSDPLLQAVKLLQLAKSARAEDVNVIQEACPSLNLNQIRKVLSIYVPDEFDDGPVCSQLLRSLSLKCQEDEIIGKPTNVHLPDIQPEAEPLHLSIKPNGPLDMDMPMIAVPSTIWKLFILVNNLG